MYILVNFLIPKEIQSFIWRSPEACFLWSMEHQTIIFLKEEERFQKIFASSNGRIVLISELSMFLPSTNLVSSFVNEVELHHFIVYL